MGISRGYKMNIEIQIEVSILNIPKLHLQHNVCDVHYCQQKGRESVFFFSLNRDTYHHRKMKCFFETMGQQQGVD